MNTTEDKTDIPESSENQENQNLGEEEQQEEEEPVDLELQKEMKGLKINESDFTNEPKVKKSAKKSKNIEDKKVKKKGQDFLDYANKNNIQINIEYEENKYQLKKKRDQKTGEKGGNKFYDNKKQYNKGPQKRQQNYNTGNKFDFGQRVFYQNYNQHQTQKLVENKEILEYLEKLFGEESLNKNLYISKRIEEGKILVDDIANYYDIKNNNISTEKIMEIIKDSQNLECINEESKNYIKIKNFDKLKLLSPQQIYENKKIAQSKKQFNQMPYQQYQNVPYQYFPYYSYINLQNNYYFYGNKSPPMYNSP